MFRGEANEPYLDGGGCPWWCVAIQGAEPPAVAVAADAIAAETAVSLLPLLLPPAAALLLLLLLLLVATATATGELL